MNCTLTCRKVKGMSPPEMWNQHYKAQIQAKLISTAQKVKHLLKSLVELKQTQVCAKIVYYLITGKSLIKMLKGGRRQAFTPMCQGDQLPGKLSPCWSLPSFGLTNPFVIPRSSAATVSPFTTLRMVNSAASVCITKGRSRSRTWSWQQNYLTVVCTRSENTLQWRVCALRAQKSGHITPAWASRGVRINTTWMCL